MRRSGSREGRSGRFILSPLVSTEYDAASRDLEVRFARTFVYSNVPRAVYEALLGAGSKRGFFHAFIRDHYSCRELQP
jgi:hypothetical protein